MVSGDRYHVPLSPLYLQNLLRLHECIKHIHCPNLVDISTGWLGICMGEETQMPTRRALIKAASISFAGAPFVNMAAPMLIAQSGSIPALSPSVQQNLKTNLTGVYNSARNRNVTTAQLGTLNGALGIANGLIEDNGTIATIQPHYYPPTFQWTSSLASSLTQNAGSQICSISVLNLAIMNSLNQYRSGVPGKLGDVHHVYPSECTP
jgi:hypothetical protein